jgi:hypothetical protein
MTLNSYTKRTRLPITRFSLSPSIHNVTSARLCWDTRAPSSPRQSKGGLRMTLTCMQISQRTVDERQSAEHASLKCWGIYIAKTRRSVSALLNSNMTLTTISPFTRSSSVVGQSARVQFLPNPSLDRHLFLPFPISHLASQIFAQPMHTSSCNHPQLQAGLWELRCMLQRANKLIQAYNESRCHNEQIAAR